MGYAHLTKWTDTNGTYTGNYVNPPNYIQHPFDPNDSVPVNFEISIGYSADINDSGNYVSDDSGARINNLGHTVYSTLVQYSFPNITFNNGISTTVLGEGIPVGLNDKDQVISSGLNVFNINSGTSATLYLPAPPPNIFQQNQSLIDINNSGQIIGTAYRTIFSENIPIWDNISQAEAEAFYNAYYVKDEYHSWLWNEVNGNYELVDLGDGYVNAINDMGLIVGTRGNENGINSNSRAMIWDLANGQVTDLNTLTNLSLADWVLGEAADINDKGWIVGNAYNSLTGASAGFLLTPDGTPSAVPLPAAVWLFGSALGGFGLMKRRKSLV